MSGGALPALAKDTRVELGRGDDIVVLGAAALLMRRELGLGLRRRRDQPNWTEGATPWSTRALD